MVTASGSGLDPDISPRPGAYVQARRVAPKPADFPEQTVELIGDDPKTLVWSFQGTRR